MEFPRFEFKHISLVNRNDEIAILCRDRKSQLAFVELMKPYGVKISNVTHPYLNQGGICLYGSGDFSSKGYAVEHYLGKTYEFSGIDNRFTLDRLRNKKER